MSARDWIAVAIAFVCATAMFGMFRVTSSVVDEFDTATARLERMERAMAEETDVMETTWKDKQGVEHTVRTFQRVGESSADWAARHQAAVTALQAIYPPAP